MYGQTSNIDGLAQQAFVNRLSATANNSILHQLCVQTMQTTPRGQEALTLVVDAARMIHAAQAQMGVTEQQAAEKAAGHVHRGYLAKTFNENPGISQQIPHNFINELPQAAQIFNNLLMDLQRFKSGAFQQPVQMQGMYGQQPNMQQYGTTGIPPISAGGLMGHQTQTSYQQPVNLSNFAVSQPAQPYNTFSTPVNPHIEVPGFDPAMYHNDLRNTNPKIEAAPLNFNLANDVNNSVPLTPTHSWGRGIEETQQPTPRVAAMASNSVENHYNPNYADYASVDPRYTHHPRMEELPIPLSPDDIKVSPFVYIPHGVMLDKDRPWDRFYAPGGIVIERADKTNFKLTPGDDIPYKWLYNPKRYARFMARWPDGKVTEVFAAWETDPEMKMDYLQHEMNQSLREQEYLRRKGRVNEVTVAELSGGSVAPLSAVAEVIKEGEVKELKNITPVVIDDVIYDLPALEAEQKAVSIIREEIGEDVDAVPAHRYMTSNRTKVNISDDVAEVLMQLKKTDDLRKIGETLKGLVNDGSISVRTMQFFNARLTEEINEVSKVGLCIEDYNIVDFVQYIDEYLEYFGGINQGYVPVMNGAINQIAGRAFNLVKVEDEWFVQDERINIQLGLDSIELGNMLPGDEACRITTMVEPAIVELVKGALTYNADNDKRDVIRIRLITIDGAYIDIIRGRLKQGSMMAYRVM